jgi:hypothetical protein
MMKQWVSSSLTIVLLFAVLLAGLNLGAQSAYACSCVGGDAKEKLERSSVVFAGKVTEIGSRTISGEVGRLLPYTFEVDRAWKGVTTKSISILGYDGESASCGISFQMNEAYLIYSSQDEEGKLTTSLCNGNVLLSDADEDLKLLGPAVVERDQLVDPPVSDTGAGAQNVWIYSVISVVILGIVLYFYLQGRKRS